MMHFEIKTERFRHQDDAVTKMLPSRVGALFMEMGTGKSLVGQRLACLRQDKFDRMFWFCPCSGRPTIFREWMKHTTLSARDVYVFDDDTTSTNVPTDARVYIIGLESMGASTRVVSAFRELVTPRSFVNVDESQYIKGYRAKRSQRVTHMCSNTKYRLLMSGTPIIRGAVDLYSQMTFLSPKVLGYRSYYSFAANHLEFREEKLPNGRKRRTSQIVRTHNEEYLASRMAPYVYQVTKEECLDLPAKIHETRYTIMSSEQRAAYNQAKREILLEQPFEDWSGVRILQLFAVLQTITCGFWNRRDPMTGRIKTLRFPHDRAALLRDTIAEIAPEERVIVWAKYHENIPEIIETLSQAYGTRSVNEYSGRQSFSEREHSLARWRSDGKILVGTKGTGGQVLTLNEACYAITYADDFRVGQTWQAEDRNHRIGQDRICVYTTLVCDESVENRIETANSTKSNVAREFRLQVQHYRQAGMKEAARRMVEAL